MLNDAHSLLSKRSAGGTPVPSHTGDASRKSISSSTFGEVVMKADLVASMSCVRQV
jgi:hypothetical protein